MTPTYDANGNLTRDEAGRQFVYDAWNRLVEVKDANGNVLKRYSYDGPHRRIQETANGTTTDLYYSDQWQVLGERVGGQTTVQYVWSPVYVDALVLRDRDSNGDGTLDERLYVGQDANYNITALFDNAGNVVERYAYDPFGQATVLDANWNVLAASAFGWVYLHQGGRFDATSGLYYFRNRDYSPTLGRWTSLDPLRYEAGDVNLYRALGNSPVNTVDLTGLDFWDWLANDVIGTDNVRSWDSVLGHHRTGWFAQGSNFFAGWGDTLSFGITSYIRRGLGYDDVVNYGSGSYVLGEGAGIAHTIAIGGAYGWSRAGIRGAGREFSHWIPARWGGPRSLWNGNYVSVYVHALADPYRYRFMSRAWKELNPIWHPVIRQWVRIPYVYKGMAAGGLYGATSVLVRRWTNWPEPNTINSVDY